MGRALSPLSHSNTAQYFDEHQAIMRNSIRKLLHPNQPSNETLENENVAQDPPSVAAPVRKPKSPPPQMNNKHTPTSPVNHTVKRMPAMPITNESPVHPPVSKVTNGHKKSKSGSVSYSTFPNGMILENSSVPPNLDGVVDLSNTVDTDVITKTLPAVTHEHVTPVRHEINEERIFREIHTHEVRHHILPVLDTEFLPTKHYVQSKDGKTLVEIPESQVPKHKITGSMNRTWSLSKRPYSSRSRTSSLTQYPVHQPANPEEYESAEAPVIGLARGDPKPRSRANSRASNHTVKTSTCKQGHKWAQEVEEWFSKLFYFPKRQQSPWQQYPDGSYRSFCMVSIHEQDQQTTGNDSRELQCSSKSGWSG